MAGQDARNEHTPQTHTGDGRRQCEDSSGWQGNTRNSRDATGINADKRRPIDPHMPQMPPA